MPQEYWQSWAERRGLDAATFAVWDDGGEGREASSWDDKRVLVCYLEPGQGDCTGLGNVYVQEKLKEEAYWLP